jgi:hypothetical protein
MSKSRSAVIDNFRRALASPVDFDGLLAKAGQKDRTNIEKHLAAIDAEHAALWQRLARSLATLAPLAMTTVGQQATQFFIADGKYRMQVFALEDQHDGLVVTYIPDVLDEALKLKIVTPEPGGVPDRYATATRGQSLHIEQMTGSNTPNPGAHYKNMLGWNRKALRVPLPITASPAQIEAVEDLAALAAQAWVNKQPAASS